MLERGAISWLPLRSWRISGVPAVLAAWHGLWRSRVALLRLDAAGLRDIGLTRAEAEFEARRSPLVD